MTNEAIKIVEKVFQKKKVQDQKDPQQNSTRLSNIYKQSFLNYSKIEAEGALPYSFYKATITLIPKPCKDRKKTIEH